MQNAIGKIIAFSDTSGIAYSYFKIRSQLVATSQMICHMMS